MTKWTLTPKRITCTCFSAADPLDLYKFDSACPEVSKYLNGEALRIAVLEKNRGVHTIHSIGLMVMRNKFDPVFKFVQLL